MSELSVLIENKKELVDHLNDILTEPLIERLQSIYDDVKNSLSLRESNTILLKKYQEQLSFISEWDKETKQDLYQYIVTKTRINYISKLIQSIIAIQVKIIIKTENDELDIPKMKFRIPSAENFIHMCLITVSRVIWKQTYLMYHNVRTIERQHNISQIEEIIKKSIATVIRSCLPLDDIYNYIKENTPQEEEEEEEEEEEDDEEEIEIGESEDENTEEITKNNTEAEDEDIEEVVEEDDEEEEEEEDEEDEEEEDEEEEEEEEEDEEEEEEEEDEEEEEEEIVENKETIQIENIEQIEIVEDIKTDNNVIIDPVLVVEEPVLVVEEPVIDVKESVLQVEEEQVLQVEEEAPEDLENELNTMLNLKLNDNQENTEIEEIKVATNKNKDSENEQSPKIKQLPIRILPINIRNEIKKQASTNVKTDAFF